MTMRYILRNILLLFVLLLNKLYEPIIKRKLQYSMGISKFTAPGPSSQWTTIFFIENKYL